MINVRLMNILLISTFTLLQGDEHLAAPESLTDITHPHQPDKAVIKVISDNLTLKS